VVALYGLAGRLHGPVAARLAAWGYALHLTFAFYAISLWSEVFYAFLLVVAAWGLLWARDGSAKRAIVPGVAVGAAVLFRGVATYLAPIFAIGLVWPEAQGWRDALRVRWKSAVVSLVAAVAVVAPYSVNASLRHGGFLVSDATLGQMMWLGNNDFPPISFDVGDGPLEPRVYDAVTAGGRPHCSRELPPAQWDRCEVRNGVDWILGHPTQFVERIPARLAQWLHPHTFLTRHLRWGKWSGLSHAFKEFLVHAVAASSLVVVLGGLASGILRGKGAFGWIAAAVVGYHALAIAALAGLSRYRLPLEPFAIVFLADAVRHPRLSWQEASRTRRGVAVLVVGLAGVAMIHSLPRGFLRPW